MAPHVEVVIRILLDAFQQIQLGEEAPDEPGGVHQVDPAARLGPGDQAPQLVKGALGRNLADPRRLRRGERARSGVNLEAEVHAKRAIRKTRKGSSANRPAPPP